MCSDMAFWKVWVVRGVEGAGASEVSGGTGYNMWKIERRWFGKSWFGKGWVTGASIVLLNFNSDSDLGRELSSMIERLPDLRAQTGAGLY